MKKNAIRFLIASFFIIVAVLLGSLILFTTTMKTKNEETINKVGNIYMESANEKTDALFEVYVSQRLQQVRGIIENQPPDQLVHGDEMFAALSHEGRQRKLEYLALLSRDGDMEMIYGEPVTLDARDEFLSSLNNDEAKVAAGVDAAGNTVILMGVSTLYDMGDGKVNTALVAGVSSSAVCDLLELDDPDSLLFSHIIRKDGSYIIKSGDDTNVTYFDRIMNMYTGIDDKQPEEYITELRNAMSENAVYSTIFLLGSERRHLYATPLPNSEWYLLTIMPFGPLDTIISELNDTRTKLLLGCILAIISTLVVIFLFYFRISQQQIRALEEARHEADRANKAKSEFLSNMSHDVRTPMNAIVGMTAIATANIDKKEQVQNCLGKINVSSQHLLGLINDILDMSKIESGKMMLSPSAVSLCEMTDNIVDITQPQCKVKDQILDVLISNIIEENVICDSLRLNQVLLNLLSNAIKFTPRGGCIQLLMYQEASPLGDSYVRLFIDVKDTGMGMDPEFAKTIFEPFTREDSKRVQQIEGSGLGMPITKYIIDAMQGSIEVESERGKGTQFHVVLDLERAPATEEDMQLRPMRTLLIDNDEMLCETTCKALRSLGLTAEWTASAEDALELLQKEHDYGMILLDHKLAGSSKMENVRSIRPLLDGGVPILLVSAYDCSEIESVAKEAGVTGFLTKPLFKSKLYCAIRQYTTDGADQKTSRPDGKPEFHGTRILLAEDNDLNYEIAEELLSEAGLRVERAENGKVCVDLFTSSEPGYFRLILMDIRMPVMDGYEATIAIRSCGREDADLPIIAMTADAFSEDIQHCLDVGMNSHIAKPIDIKRVLQLLKEHLPDA